MRVLIDNWNEIKRKINHLENAKGSDDKLLAAFVAWKRFACLGDVFIDHVLFQNMCLGVAARTQITFVGTIMLGSMLNDVRLQRSFSFAYLPTITAKVFRTSVKANVLQCCIGVGQFSTAAM